MRFLTGKCLSRRAVLRGAGVTVGLPLLQSMLPAGRAWAAGGVPQSRLGCIYIPHGAVMSRFTPSGDGEELTLSPTLASLEPHRARLNVVSDTTLPNAYGADASAGANHIRSSSVWLTGAKPGSEPVPSMGISLDQVAAQHFGQETPLPSLEVAMEEGATISWRAPTVPLPMQNNPQLVFTRLFGDGATNAERTARRALSQSLLDSVVTELGSLEAELPHDDRTRLDQYLTDVREVERRIELAASRVTDAAAAPAKPAGIPDDYEEHAGLLIDLVALAWAADLTRVTTFMVGRETNQRVFPRSGITEAWHNLSHHSEIPAKRDRVAQLNAYHTRTIMGRMLDKLAATPDGGGTLLDHSLVLYGSGMSNSNQHDHEPLPILVAGGASGKLRGGRHVRAGKGTPLSNLQVAVLDKLGVPAQSFGDSTGALSI